MSATPSLPIQARFLAQAACAVGVGVWGAILWAPGAHYPPPALAPTMAGGLGTASVAAWFGGTQARVRIQVMGLIAGADGYGSALLAVDGAAPRAFRVGDELAAGVRLQGVGSQGIQIQQDGEVREVAAPADARQIPQGILRVPG